METHVRLLTWFLRSSPEMLDTVNRGRTGGWDRASPAQLSGGPWLLPARLAVGPPPPSTTKSPRARPPSPWAPPVPAAGGGTEGQRPRDLPGLQQPAPRVHPQHWLALVRLSPRSPAPSSCGSREGTAPGRGWLQGLCLLPAALSPAVEQGDVVRWGLPLSPSHTKLSPESTSPSKPLPIHLPHGLCERGSKTS